MEINIHKKKKTLRQCSKCKRVFMTGDNSGNPTYYCCDCNIVLFEIDELVTDVDI